MMTDAPEQIWAEPGMPGYTDEPNELYTVEYVRADIIEETNKHFVEMADRIEELEAKLAKAVEILAIYEKSLREFATSTDVAADEAEDFLDRDGGRLAATTIAELKGDNDE